MRDCLRPPYHSAKAPAPGEHWLPDVERVGVLGDLITRANHYAITVTDVGKSLNFYRNVLGLQQIRRPNFDRYGAWLTAGNLEIHLIKGPAVVPNTDSLIVGHLSLETNNIQEVRKRLVDNHVPFTQNVSVPNKKQTTVVTQFFLRDPDGYYVEICNCDILTEFCLCKDGKDASSLGYNETSVAISMIDIMQLLRLGEHARVVKAQRSKETAAQLILPPAEQARQADPEKLARLVKRTKNWGSLMQGETEESLALALMQANNSVPLATRIIRAQKGGKRVFVPPAVYRAGEELYQPKGMTFNMDGAMENASKADKRYMEDPDARYKDLFDVIDSDNTGFISAENVVKLLQHTGGSTEAAAEEEATSIVNKYDTNHDKGISYSEFLAMAKEMLCNSAKDTWTKVFDLCDDDGNGTLQVPELFHKLSDMGLNLDDEAMEELFIDADQAGDGVLSRQEFCEIMSQRLD